ncbi:MULTISPECIES: lipoyl(octanoyl) transferase LipB [Methylomonas]|uniref:Octanoyltransferase n=2 Tax=Methylomonas TaxID=416 RepID=A0A126T2H0_9GAMM|nr:MULTISPECIES: lipoyl(octanoyl) transferase LipB [Methylomonas]AMK75914.1 octanoyltransferase [Methylomonas denitrificans]OAI01301.1 octanoyltransferase [Methylomonas methanica]TCV79211.1 lipoyl(octanoyl) transferase [Methylomonas methanica]
MPSKATTVLRNLGKQGYLGVWRDMQQFTAERDSDTADQIWIVEHPPVYTLGLNGKREHLLKANAIEIVESDRGGQVTYHGPGQLVIYLLADLRRLNKGPRQMVTILEDAMINTLRQYGIAAQAQPKAPGVYVNERKIASLGLRIKHGCCYHGLSINNDMDLAPFADINPCGYAGLQVTQLADLGVKISTQELAVPVVHQLLQAIEI